MKIAILGGSFDPPHVGHVLIAQQVRDILGMDEVWLMPLFEKIHQDKIFHKILSSVEDRLAMAKLLENNFIKVSDFEIKNNKTSYTIDTLRLLTEKFPEDTFYWILGSDQLALFQRYYQWQTLVTSYNLIIFPRDHNNSLLEEKVKVSFDLQTIPENVIVINDKDVEVTDISSSEIRKKVQAKQMIDKLVPKNVEAYIKKRKLYGN